MTERANAVSVDPLGTNGSQGVNDGGEEGAMLLFIVNQIVVPVVFGLTSLLGIIGNSLVIYVILSRKKMRTVTNILLLNLAFADLAFVLVIPNFTAFQYATDKWIFGGAFCKIMHYLVNVTAYVTVYTLVLISVVRYLTIVRGMATIRLRTKKNIVLAILFIWVVVLILNTPVILSYGTMQSDSPGDYICVHLSKAHAQKIFSTFFVFGYLLPLIVIAILSVCILHHLRSQKPMALKGKKTEQKKRKAGRLLILVVVVFAILWLPVHIHLLFVYFGSAPDSPWYAAVSVLFNLMAYFNECVNPIIYNQASKEFRDAFREVIFCVPCSARTRTSAGTGGESMHCTTVTTRLMGPGDTNGATTHDKLLMSEVKGGENTQSDEV